VSKYFIGTEFLEGQGLGNQLWVYASMRGIAKKLKFNYWASHNNRFKGNAFLDLSYTNINEEKDRTYINFYEKQFFDKELNCLLSDFDPDVLEISETTFINGNFQSEKYFFEYSSELSEWVKLKDEFIEYSHQFKDLCILNIRGGEYKRHNNLILPKSYWENGMKNINEKFNLDNFLIVTDDISYAKALFPNISVLDGDIAHCYAALYGASSLIVSNSSFSYFPIKTRKDSPYVIAPYQWARFGNKFDRWASPANLYKDWSWMDINGEILDSRYALRNQQKTKKFYEAQYKICTDINSIRNRNLISLIPGWVKKPIKLILSILFPRNFGK